MHEAARTDVCWSASASRSRPAVARSKTQRLTVEGAVDCIILRGLDTWLARQISAFKGPRFA